MFVIPDNLLNVRFTCGIALQVSHTIVALTRVYIAKMVPVGSQNRVG